jgi:hypothetical protein
LHLMKLNNITFKCNNMTLYSENLEFSNLV